MSAKGVRKSAVQPCTLKRDWGIVHLTKNKSSRDFVQHTHKSIAKLSEKPPEALTVPDGAAGGAHSLRRHQGESGRAQILQEGYI
jgi:hypothetical protein